MSLKEIVAGIFILIFVSGFVLAVLSHLEEKRFLKWLSINNPQMWEELGSPQIFFFDSEPDNPYYRGTSAWEFLKSTGGLDEFAIKHSNEKGIYHLQRSRRYNKLSKFLMVAGLIFAIGISAITSS